MNQIIKSLETHSHSVDILKDVYGIDSSENFDLVIVAPSWDIEKVFNDENYHYIKIYEDRFSVVHCIKINNKKLLYVRLQIGAPNMIDFCLSCYKLNCKEFIFLGSAGSLDRDIKIGDIIVPSCAISGNGSTIYLNDTFKNAFLEKTFADKSLNKKLKGACEKTGLATADALVISVDSVVAEYAHLNEFKKMKAKIIEMEVATFFASMKLIKKEAAAVLVISDNSTDNQHLIGRSEEVRKVYQHSRNIIHKIITNLTV